MSREDLAQRFELLSDEDLVATLRSGTLTPLATEVASEILSLRGLALPSLPGAADSTGESPVEVDYDESDLVTVAVQWDVVRANLLRTLLESHGIFVHLWGEHLATMNVFLSNASGGTRLQVPRAQVSHANELIGAFERGELESPDLPDEDADIAPTTHANPYTPPANPYVPSPATIAARPSDWAPARPVVGATPTLTAAPQSEERGPTPSSPLRKAVLLIIGSAVVVALWFMFTH